MSTRKRASSKGAADKGKSEASVSLLHGSAPDPKNLADVMKVMPKDKFEIRLGFAFWTAFRVWLCTFAGLYMTVVAPWYLLPFAWIFYGTAATGLFVVAHDCAHQSFSKSRTLNEIVGTICMMPLMFPYNSWEVTHNNHHAHSNNLERDHLWRPMTKEEVAKMSPVQKFISYYMFGPLFFESSIIHHAYHFLVPVLSKKNPTGTRRSVAMATLGGIITIYALSQVGPIWKTFLVPFLVFEFWLSTFTYFHHRHPRGVGWKTGEDWDKVYGSLFATVHMAFPSWVEFLTLDINWHLPHHVSAQIPWYNLRRCTHALMKAYGDRLMEDEFSWELWKETTTQCHVYDKEKGYVPM